jgi:hypothetical protein
MGDYRKFDFVCELLEALARGDEVVVDKRRIFRLDTSQYNLKDECADVLALVREHRQGNPIRGPFAVQAMHHGIVGELRALREAVAAAFDEANRPKKGSRRARK